MITSECINCGACEPECPNTAIYQGGVEWQAQDGGMHPRALERDLLHRPREVHRVRRLPRPRGVRRGLPGRLLRARTRDIPETHDVLLARARDAASRARRSPTTRRRASRRTGAADAAPAARRSRRRPRRRPLAAPAAARGCRARRGRAIGLAIPPPEEWEVPIHCFRCQGEYAVPFRELPRRHRVPVPALPRLLRAHAQHGARASPTRSSASTPRGRTTFERFHEQAAARARAVRGAAAPASWRASSRSSAASPTRERAPGAPIKRRPFWSF